MKSIRNSRSLECTLRAALLCGFASAAVAGTPELPVNLGSAGNFAILAGTTVTNVNSVGTVVVGDLGISPGTAVTGFPPGVLVGTMHLGDPTAATAQVDLTTAYNDAAGRAATPNGLSGNLGGSTITPGAYNSTGSMEISSGDLTLDAQGDPSAVFIFQMATTLDVSAGRAVILAGNAQASNVFWQVGTSATFGAGAVVKGIILADVAISFGTAAALDGKALARSAAVTLDANSLPVELDSFDVE